MWRFVTGALLVLPSIRSQPQQPILDIPDDLACEKGSHSAAWAKVKSRFRQMIEDNPNIFKALPREVIQNTVNAAIADVKESDGFNKAAGDECGLGRLGLQLLSIAILEDPGQLVQAIEATKLGSPVLTLLLDIPWVATALSGWPLFGILAQVNAAKVSLLKTAVNMNGIDGLEGANGVGFLEKIRAAADAGDLVTMTQASVAYLEDGKTDAGPLAGITALSTQSAMQTDVQKRLGSVQTLQQMLRTMIDNVGELEVALTTRWPLWPLLHISVDAFSST